jgi:hypothetical protein
MFAGQAPHVVAQSMSSAQVVIFVFSAIIVAFWRVILRVIIAIFAVVLIAVLLSGAVVVADFMHR